MPGSHHRSLQDRLPHLEQLPEDAQRRWAHVWLCMILTQPRYYIVRLATYAPLVAACFYFDLTAVLPGLWKVLPFAIIFGIGEEVVCAVSRPEIGARITEELATQRPNQAIQRTADRPYA